MFALMAPTGSEDSPDLHHPYFPNPDDEADSIAKCEAMKQKILDGDLSAVRSVNNSPNPHDKQKREPNSYETQQSGNDR